MNKFFISGNLVKKPELKKSEKGNAYCTITIANDLSKDKTNFFDIKVFDKLAVNCCSLLNKGFKVLATCYLINNNYESKKPCHCKHYELSIIASAIEFMQGVNHDNTNKEQTGPKAN